MAWRDNVKRVPRRKRQPPGKPDKEVIMFYADEFLRRYSSDKSLEFAERFFEVVTRKTTGKLDEVTGKLDWQRRKVRKARRTKAQEFNGRKKSI
jgi:hypothetical protein